MAVPTTPPKTRTFTLDSQVRKAWGDAWHKRDDAYVWPGKRIFKQPDDGGAIYNGSST